jgi:hypothetical protein
MTARFSRESWCGSSHNSVLLLEPDRDLDGAAELFMHTFSGNIQVITNTVSRGLPATAFVHICSAYCLAHKSQLGVSQHPNPWNRCRQCVSAITRTIRHGTIFLRLLVC